MTIEQKIQSLFFYGKNWLAKEIYLRTGKLTPTPINFYLQTSFKCNARCKMCFIWAQKDRELSLRYWKLAVDQIVEWCGPSVKLNIAGGEVMDSPMSYKLLEYAASKSYMTGLTTNGYSIDDREARKLIKMRLSNINISLDGTDPKTVNFLRGRDDFFERTVRSIKCLVAAKKKYKSSTKIIIKTLIMSHNLEEIVEIYDFVMKLGADYIYYQPTYAPLEGNWSQNQFKESHLWPKEDKHLLINKVFDSLNNLKKRGANIVNSLTHLEGMRDYLLGIHINKDRKNFCDLDLTTMMIKQKGDIYFCNFYSSLGNIQDLEKKSIRSMVLGEKVEKLRRTMRICGKNCLSPCFSQKSISDYVSMSTKLIGWFD